MKKERRGPLGPAALSLVRRTLAGERGLSRGPVFAMAGVVVFLLAVVVLLQTTDILPGTTRAETAGTTIRTGPVTTAWSSGAGGGSPDPSTSVNPHPIENPARIVIPAIGVDASLVHVGNRSDGSMDLPPYGLAAWYKLGPVPGAPGPSVIIGHVDSKKRADVFNKLEDLKPGDVILVFGKNGDVAQFEAGTSELILKNELPTERIWNKTTQPVLRLVTCGGKWDSSIGHYLSNLIVYCHLVK